MIENIKHNEKLLSIIVRANFKANDIKFFTPNEFSQQLGYINRDKGSVIEPHMHNVVKREISYSKEVLLIRSGKVRIDFYDEKKNYIESRILFKGDVILLAYGGHGFEMIEKTEIIEIKQGPYLSDENRTRFPAISKDLIKIRS